MIKILRLKTGEDIICFVDKKRTKTEIRHPLLVYINHNTKSMTQELVIGFWLPENLIEKSKVILQNSEILFEMEPKQSFKEYYFNFLNGMEDSFDLEKEEKELIQDILDGFDAKYLNKLH